MQPWCYILFNSILHKEVSIAGYKDIQKENLAPGLLYSRKVNIWLSKNTKNQAPNPKKLATDAKLALVLFLSHQFKTYFTSIYIWFGFFFFPFQSHLHLWSLKWCCLLSRKNKIRNECYQMDYLHEIRFLPPKQEGAVLYALPAFKHFPPKKGADTSLNISESQKKSQYSRFCLEI